MLRKERGYGYVRWEVECLLLRCFQQRLEVLHVEKARHATIRRVTSGLSLPMMAAKEADLPLLLDLSCQPASPKSADPAWYCQQHLLVRLHRHRLMLRPPFGGGCARR